jgi:hypothetical protein
VGMGKLIYISEDSDNREANAITFEVVDDLTISEFKIICMRMASAMGYSQTIIEKSFGSDEILDKQFEELKKDVMENIINNMY